MNPVKAFFLRTLDDMRARAESTDAYEVLGFSALIRKLFLDDFPLVDQVNREHRVKLEFEVAPTATPPPAEILALGPSVWSLQDGLDPDTSPRPDDRTVLKREQFFAATVLIVEGQAMSVRDVVAYEANVMGGVHAGSPKQDKEHALASINGLYVGGGTRASERQLKSIARVILRALEPLKSAVMDKH